MGGILDFLPLYSHSLTLYSENFIRSSYSSHSEKLGNLANVLVLVSAVHIVSIFFSSPKGMFKVSFCGLRPLSVKKMLQRTPKPQGEISLNFTGMLLG